MTKINVDPFENRKTFFRCPSCYCLLFERKQALSHAEFEHFNLSLKFNRFNIYSTYKCHMCKSNPSCTLIQFPCSGNICLKCLPNSATACEVELPDEIYRYALQLSCPLCQQMHELDPEIGMMIYIANKPRCWLSQ